MKGRHKGRRRANHSKPTAKQRQHDQAIDNRDKMKFYRTMMAVMVKRAGGSVVLEKPEYESLIGQLQWRRTETDAIEFLFISPVEPGPET